jgi:hypothetical protein
MPTADSRHRDSDAEHSAHMSGNDDPDLAADGAARRSRLDVSTA